MRSRYSSLKRMKNCSGIALLFFSGAISASEGNFYLEGSLGTSTARLSHSNPSITYYGGLLNDAYPLQETHRTTLVLGVNGGYEWAACGKKPALALGLGVYGLPSNLKYGGKVIETALGDPSSILYNYRLNISSTRLMPTAQLTWDCWNLLPFIRVGAGSAWNRVNDYKEYSNDDLSYPPLPPFQSQTKSNFSYELGAGIAYAFNLYENTSSDKQDRISLAYRYLDLGRASLGMRGPVYPYSLDLGRLSTNEFYIGYTHLFTKGYHEIAKG